MPLRIPGTTLCCVTLTSVAPAFAQKVYFVETYRYQLARANLDGTGYEVVRASPKQSAGAGFFLDWPSGWLYAYDPDTLAITRSHLDGRHPEPVVSEVFNAVKCLAVDTVHDMVYWTQFEPPFLRSAPMGGDTGDLLALDACDVDDVCYLKDVLVDPSGEKIYWSEYVDFGAEVRGRILRADLDGANVEPIYQSAPKTRATIWDLELDETGSQIYWVDTSRYEVGRVGTDGEGAEVILDRFDGIFGALALSIDRVQQKLYYFPFTLHRANLDGTGIETLSLQLAGQPGYIAIDPRQAGDVNADLAVDLQDFAAFQRCFGADASLAGSPTCAFFDVEGSDDDVDSADYSAWLLTLTGPPASTAP